MKKIDWDKLMKTCPWGYQIGPGFSAPHCSAQPNECHPSNCAIVHFIEFINKPYFVLEDEETK